jgi:hypothetical protein
MLFASLAATLQTSSLPEHCTAAETTGFQDENLLNCPESVEECRWQHFFLLTTLVTIINDGDGFKEFKALPATAFLP